MKVGIIGVGRVGSALAIGLSQEGITISGACSRNQKSVAALNNRLGTEFENILYLTVKNCDLVFITVPDTQIGSVAEKITEQASRKDLKDKYFLHCSGALSSDVLECIKRKGGYIGCLHPIQTFADRENGWKGLYNIYFGFEGSTEVRSKCEHIVNLFESKTITIEKGDKPIYHAAACVLSNYTVVLSYIAEKMLSSIGIDSETALKAFGPLIRKTVENVITKGSIKALTGPISRGDYKVVEEHMKEIKEKIPEVLQVYKILGKTAVEMALNNGSIDSEKIEKLCKIL